MESLIDRIRNGLDAGQYPNERAVSTSIVIPILRKLGWDDSDPTQVMPEYSNPRGRVDYALSPKTNSPAVFIEVKRVGQSADADRQLFEYAFHEGAQIAVLTDGRLWNFYLPGQHGSYEDRRVYQLDIVERDTPEISHRFRRYLAKERVASGAALADATSDYQAGASRKVAELTLPTAWGQIVGEPDGLLMELVRDRTEALCGHKPSDAALEAFLKGRLGAASDILVPIRAPRVRAQIEAALRTISDVAVTEVAKPPVNSVRRNSWRVGSQSGVERNGNDALTAVLSALFISHPQRQETMAAAVRTRGRNNIARVIDEIYPSKPEIARKYHRQLPNGWYVGTNESSATKTRIVGQATKAAGLILGKDVEFEV